MPLEHGLFGRLSAKQVCVLMFWASKAGNDAATQYVLHPHATTGHYARQLRGALGHLGSNAFYDRQVPSQRKHDSEHSSKTLACMPLHEQVGINLQMGVGNRTRLRDDFENAHMPPAYTTHPVVSHRGPSGERLLPIVLLIDAVPYSLTGSVIGFWGVNLLSKQRFLYAAFRKT